MQANNELMNTGAIICDRYKVIKKLGQGSFGTIFLGKYQLDTYNKMIVTFHLPYFLKFFQIC